MLNTTNKITIWQQNVNKSPSCQHDLLSNNQLIRSGTSIIALQEPAVNFMNRSIASKDWFPIYPTTHSLSPDKTRSLLLINASINSGSWEQIDIPSGDITAVIIRSAVSDLLLYNVYNDGNNDTSLNALTIAHNIVSVTPSVKRRHIIWLGDFNRHHPVWDNANDTHLFTKEALTSAERPIEAIAEAGLDLALPAGIPTHIHNVTKHWTRLDHIFISDHSLDSIISCNTRLEFRGIKTDHLPIVTELDLEILVTEQSSVCNFREVD
jgi:exonuclease III